MYKTNFKPLFFLLFTFLILGHLNLKAQVIQKYDVSIAGISIGEMTAKKFDRGEETVYELSSNVSFWFFGRINLDYFTKTIYNGKMLRSANLTSTTNRGNFKSDIDWKGDHYKIQTTNYKYELDTTINRPLYFSAAVFYFQEPKQVKEFMAEAYGLPSPIEKKGDYYEVDVNGNRNRFYYKNGQLEKAVMQFPVKNYVITRKE
ncbi:DUF6134 family protein [Mongoliibacter ruber]|uniref:DUF3108 domain-containing protein n=1 Tax=Mongoliibacter ruber TaxID=1750599 RepID=A0A2T0WW59_9BACT|nr:DUF6134 family protein [Mongoliibacter ruber]PRY90824.1 hypothetical protein CLW00_101499 [Mongoliibacter ruber]